MIILSIVAAVGGVFLMTLPILKASLDQNKRIVLVSSGLVWVLRNLVFEARVGQPLAMAIATTNLARVSEMPFLSQLQGRLLDRFSLIEACRSLRHLNLSPAERMIESVLSMPGSSGGALQSGLEGLGEFFSLVFRQIRQEKARTSQCRAQFFLVASLIPFLFAINGLIIPDLVLLSLKSGLGIPFYGTAALIYVLSIWLFLRLQGRSFSFLYQPARSEKESGKGHLCSQLEKQVFIIHSRIRRYFSTVNLSVREQTSRLGFLCTLQMAARAGFGSRRSLEQAVLTFPCCELANLSLQILQIEGGGTPLKAAFESVLNRTMAKGQDGCGAMEIMTWIGRTCAEQKQFLEATQMLLKEARERLSELGEERSGKVSSEMLIPMCLGLLPAALLMLLTPIVSFLMLELGR